MARYKVVGLGSRPGGVDIFEREFDVVASKIRCNVFQVVEDPFASFASISLRLSQPHWDLRAEACYPQCWYVLQLAGPPPHPWRAVQSMSQRISEKFKFNKDYSIG